MGLFMAFQYPVAIPGVTVAKYLRMAINAHREARGEDQIKLKDFRKRDRGGDGAGQHPARSSPAATSTTASPAARRSGWRSCSWRCCSRRWRCSTRPTPASTSTRCGSSPRASTRFAGPDMGVLIITHYQRILHLVEPDSVHVMFDGRIVKEGGPELVEQLEEKGYGWIREEVEAAPSRRPRRWSRRRPRAPSRRAVPDREGPRRLPGAASARSTASRSPTSTPAPPRSGCSPRSRRSTATSARHHSNVHRGSHTLSAEATAAYEGARATVADHIGAADRREVDLRPQRDRGDQPRRPRLGRRQRRRRRPDRADRDGAPLQHRPLAAARRARRRRDRLGRRSPTTGCSTWTPSRRCSSAGRSSSPSPTSPTCSEPTTRSPRSRRLAHDAGALVLVDGAQAAPKLPLDMAALGVDFYAITGHKLYAPDRDRRALGPARAAARDAAVPRRRLDDPQGDQARGPPGPTCRPGSRPAPRRSRRRSGWPRRCAGSTRSGWTRSSRTSARSPPTRSSGWPRSPA